MNKNDAISIYVYMCIHILRMCAQLCLTLCDPRDYSSTDRIFHWSELPFPSPGDLPDMYIGIYTLRPRLGRQGEATSHSRPRAVTLRSHPEPEAKGGSWEEPPMPEARACSWEEHPEGLEDQH